MSYDDNARLADHVCPLAVLAENGVRSPVQATSSSGLCTLRLAITLFREGSLRFLAHMHGPPSMTYPGIGSPQQVIGFGPPGASWPEGPTLAPAGICMLQPLGVTHTNVVGFAHWENATTGLRSKPARQMRIKFINSLPQSKTRDVIATGSNFVKKTTVRKPNGLGNAIRTETTRRFTGRASFGTFQHTVF